MTLEIKSYRDLIVWQKAMELCVEIYKLTEKLPPTEVYGLTSQIRRSVVSISSNIAEGRARGTRKDFSQFIRISYASGAELETQVEILKRLPFGEKLNYTIVDSLLNEVMRMLNRLLNSLKSSP